MFRKIKFQSKMILVQIVIVGFVASALMGIFYWYVVDAMASRANEDFVTIADSVVSQFDNHLYSMDRTALMVAANPTVVQTFMKTDGRGEGDFFIEEPLVTTEMIKLLNSYNFKKDGFARICLYNEDHDFVCTATTATTATGIEAFFSGNTYKALRDYFLREGNFVYFIPPIEDVFNDSGLSGRRYFSVVRQIKDYMLNSQPCGYVEVQEFSERLDGIFKGLGKEAYGAVISRDGSVVYHSPSTEGTKELEMIGQLALQALEDGGQKGAFSSMGRSVYYKEMDNAPFLVIIEKEKGALMRPLYQFHALMAAGMLLILITAIVTEVLMVRKLSGPLIELNRSVKDITMDHFHLDLKEEDTNDELIQLKDAFNIVLDRMRQSTRKQYAAEMNALKSHLFALQSQMNPHFLHNILAIISMESQMDGNDKIENMCARLCSMLSFTSTMGDGFCTMRDEMDNAVNYMILMKERYEELFEYEVDMEEGLSVRRVPKLILQPICENCFSHSFKRTEPIWRIRMKAWSDQESWYVRIQDNGTGFEKEYLKKFETMRAEMTVGSVGEKLEQISIGGLCIPNIYMRLMICYGEDMVYSLTNDEKGAVVLLGGRLDD